jgi:hypothetical protein
VIRGACKCLGAYSMAFDGRPGSLLFEARRTGKWATCTRPAGVFGVDNVRALGLHPDGV